MPPDQRSGRLAVSGSPRGRYTRAKNVGSDSGARVSSVVQSHGGPLGYQTTPNRG
jgi:hypothetical protein